MICSDRIGEEPDMNVRWDAVVDRAAVAARETQPPPIRAAEPDAGGIEVHVRLFGALASTSAERSFRLELPAAATIADVVALLGDRLGDGFLAQVLNENGAKRRHCRLFVGGYPIEDVQTALHAAPDPSEIDIILLIAPEGG
jgi:hypothetical protein